MGTEAAAEDPDTAQLHFDHALVDTRFPRFDRGTARRTAAPPGRTNARCEPTNGPHLGWMALVGIFLLGIANFALHRAALDSGHPLLGRSPWFVHLLGGRITLATEFLLLFAALLLAAQGSTWVGWGYLGYSMLNGIAAWLILTRRV